MNRSEVIGWDVGGAHLKAARVGRTGRLEEVVQLPCPLWQGMDRLHGALRDAGARLGPASVHAITMTGEMVDLFRDRPSGVKALVDVLAGSLGATGATHFYAGNAGFVDAAGAPAQAARIASANWHATAAFAARHLPDALLVDVGSTTTDVCPIAGGKVRARAWGDAQRLEQQELVYSGVVRTPLMALARHAPFEGRWVPLMAEFFATTADIYRLTEQLPADADQHPAADGGEKSVAGSAQRLARMLGRDADDAPLAQWRQLAHWFARHQLQHVAAACRHALSLERLPDTAPILGAGAGRFIVEQLAQDLGRPYRDYAALLPDAAAGPGWTSTCAPAVAVAYLLRGRAG